MGRRSAAGAHGGAHGHLVDGPLSGTGDVRASAGAVFSGGGPGKLAQFQFEWFKAVSCGEQLGQSHLFQQAISDLGPVELFVNMFTRNGSSPARSGFAQSFNPFDE